MVEKKYTKKSGNVPVIKGKTHKYSSKNKVNSKDDKRKHNYNKSDDCSNDIKNQNSEKNEINNDTPKYIRPEHSIFEQKREDKVR